MAYVEWLRVRGCWKWTGIVLGAIFLIAVVLRIVVIGIQQDVYGWAGRLQSDPGTKVTDTVLPDGTRQVDIYDPLKKQRVVIDDRGWNGKHITVYDWSPTAARDLSHDVLREGGLHVNVTPEPYGRGERIDVETNGTTPFFNYLINGVIIAMILATVLGAPFAREADGHLEIALTKPVSRDLFALQTILVDFAGLVAVFLAGTIFSIVVHALFELPHITFDQRDAIVLAAGIVAPLAWYAMLTAATASMSRGYGAILGFSWPIAAIVVGLALFNPQDNLLLTALHDVAWVLSWIDPLRYMHFGTGTASVNGHSIANLTGGEQLGALAALTILYVGLAIYQWRRVEA